MAFVDDLVGRARREWTRWGGPLERLDGTLVGFSSKRMEAAYPFWTYAGEYWRSIGSHLDGRDPPAWSAAFISFCFKEAAAGDRFPYNENHSIYAAAIAAGGFDGLSLEDPNSTRLSKGDLLWASRTGLACRKPPLSYSDAKKQLRKIHDGTGSTFCSHSDIVVEIRLGEVDVIGGNVKNAVTRTTYKLDAQGAIRDGRRSFIGVIKNKL